MLATLLPALREEGKETVVATLHDGTRGLSRPVWRRIRDVGPAGIPAVVVVDGYEQLGFAGRFALHWASRFWRLGLLVTSHRPPRKISVLCRTSVTSEQALVLVDHLTGNGPDRLVWESDVREALAAHGGNLREAFFDLYDRQERRGGRLVATVLYLHGLGSQPGGVKPTWLTSQGFTVINPALDNADFDEALRTARETFERERPDVVVGSSRGGAVAMDLDTGAVPVVLIAPAWRKWGDATTVGKRTVILHSRDDRVIPFADSIALVAASGLPESALKAVGDDHNMVDDAALQALKSAIERAVSNPS